MSEESKQFRDETDEHQQSRENNHITDQNRMVSEWPEQVSPQVPVSASLPSTIVFNCRPQTNFAHVNNEGSAYSFNSANRLCKQFGNGLPSTSNGIPDGCNNWFRPVHAGQILTNPRWNTVSGSSTSSVNKPKRNRTAFTATQLMVLEQEYKKNNFLDRDRRASLSRILRLHERIVKIWFQNRRMKDKKMKPDTNNLEEEASSTTGIPIIIEEHEMREVFSQNAYVEQYSAASTSTPTPMLMAQANQAPMLNGFNAPYIPEEFNQYQQQVHFQIQHYGPSPACLNQFQVIIDDSSPSGEELLPSPPDATHNITDAKLDTTWVNNVNIDDD